MCKPPRNSPSGASERSLNCSIRSMKHHCTAVINDDQRRTLLSNVWNHWLSRKRLWQSQTASKLQLSFWSSAAQKCTLHDSAAMHKTKLLWATLNQQPYRHGNNSADESKIWWRHVLSHCKFLKANVRNNTSDSCHSHTQNTNHISSYLQAMPPWFPDLMRDFIGWTIPQHAPKSDPSGAQKGAKSLWKAFCIVVACRV